MHISGRDDLCAAQKGYINRKACQASKHCTERAFQIDGAAPGVFAAPAAGSGGLVGDATKTFIAPKDLENVENARRGRVPRERGAQRLRQISELDPEFDR